MKFWISFDEIKWSFHKNAGKHFIRIMKIFWKNARRFGAYFAEINFRIRKVLRKFPANVEEILGRIRKIFDWTWKIVRIIWGNVKILYKLKNRRMSGEISKNFLNITRNVRENLEEIRCSEKMYNFNEI